MARVTIIIPVYNRLNLLNLVIKGIEHHGSFIQELVVSDDGSDEDVLGLLENYATDLNFNVKYLRQERNGFRAAKCRNNGIRAASGEYIIFIDQDIIPSKGYYQRFVDNMEKGAFLVAYPVRLSKEQTSRITTSVIEEADYKNIITKKQVRKIHAQFYQESYYFYKRKILKKIIYKPKLRSGVFGIHKESLIKVNGFDENYKGWGNEDDDLGRRLCQSGIIGKNVFKDEYPIHLYHEPHDAVERKNNSEYNLIRKEEIKAGDYIARNGVSNPLDDKDIKMIELN